MSSPTIKFTPDLVGVIAKGIGFNAYICDSCKNIVYPYLEISSGGELSFEIDIQELRGGIANRVTVAKLCRKCAEKYCNIMKNNFASNRDK